MEHPKVIIVMTTPFSTSSSSRSLDAYFHNWEKDRVRQIFSRNWKPQKGHCGELFQITDAALLRRWFRPGAEVGTLYRYDELEEQGVSRELDASDLIAKGYSLGRLHTPLVELLRALLWRERFWRTEKLLRWLDAYQPELIFYNFTNNLFLQKIVLFLAERYDIPIVTAIGDDYYFNDKKSLSPAYRLFRRRFKRLTEEVFSRRGSAVYVCDKIRDRYNARFGLGGETVYFNSELTRKPFAPIDRRRPVIVYFGNIRLGRDRALLDIADALGQIDPAYRLEIYTNERDEVYVSALKRHPAVVWGGSISYAEVMAKATACDIYVAAEGFREEDLVFTRCSLSTKAADGLASGAAVLAYGPAECGLIDYLQKTGAAAVCTDPAALRQTIERLLSDTDAQRARYDRALAVSQKNHSLAASTAAFEAIARRVTQR